MNSLLVKAIFPALALALFVPAGKAQTTIYVDGVHGSDSNPGTSPSAPVKTLGKGVSLVAAGGTVRVAPADYSEAVVVSKSLTLLGSGPQITRNSVPGGTAFLVKSSRVTLARIGISVQGNTSRDAPLVLEPGATNTVLRNLILAGGMRAILAGSSPDLLVEGCFLGGGGQVHAIQVTGDSDRVTIQECTFSNLKGSSILADPGPGSVLEDWVLRKCTFLNRTAPSIPPGACLEMPRVRRLLVEECDFSGFLNIALLFENPARTSSGTEPPPEDITIRGNTFHRSFGGTTSRGKGVITVRYGLSHLDLAGNRIEDVRDGSGVYMEAGPGSWQTYTRIRISGNTIKGLSGQFRGKVSGTWDADAVTLDGLGAGAWSPNNILRANNFSGNAGYGVRNIGTNAPPVDARWNWWGGPGGPSGPGGDGVSGNVDSSTPLAFEENLEIRSWKVGGRPSAVLVVDLDGKGGPDLAAVDYEAGKVEILLADGKGGFLPPQTIRVGKTPCRLAAGDFDGDGDKDLAVANTNDGTISILTNTKGTLAVTSTLQCGIPVIAVAAGKVGTDNRDDLVAAVARTPFQAGKTLYFDHAAGTPAVIKGLSDPADLVLWDMDGDGDLDLAAAQTGTRAGIYLVANQGGTFSSSPAGPFSLGVASPIQVNLNVADLDRDGNPDVIAGVTPMISFPLKPSEVRVFFGAKGLSLHSSTRVYSGKGFLKIRAGKSLGNGFTDLFVLDLAEGTLAVLEDMNPTSRTFFRTTWVCPSAAPRGLALGDLDGNGDDEAVVTSFSTLDVSVTSFTVPPAAITFGTGCPGVTGTPVIEARGNPVLGNLSFRMGLSSAAPWTAAILLASSTMQGTLDVGPCQVVVLGSAVSNLAGTDGTGKAALPLPIPLEPTLLGATAYFQWFALDKKGLLGPGYYSSSPGLRLRLGW